MNLTLDAIAVSAKHPTDESCFVVVVKTRDYCFQINVAETALAVLFSD